MTTKIEVQTSITVMIGETTHQLTREDARTLLGALKTALGENEWRIPPYTPGGPMIQPVITPAPFTSDQRGGEPHLLYGSMSGSSLP